MVLALSSGTSTDLGRRPYQQDDFLICHTFPNYPHMALFAVFDGHGSEGGKSSAFVKKVLPEVMCAIPYESFLRDPAQALKSIFSECHERLTGNQAIDTYMSGTTALVALVDTSTAKIYIAHVGDSKAILVQHVDNVWKGIQLTTDHTCETKPELDRVTTSGARVEQLYINEQKEGPLRIFKGTLPYPGLVVTRSLGDAVASRLGVVSEPEVICTQISQHDHFLVLGTDGVFDGLTIAEAVAIIKNHHKDPQKASEAITKESLIGMDRNQMDDNTTNIVISFNRP
ncbi:phosphatase 2C-like domain-containing protein [Polychytrium aggregatum]|uniref:phosphatase 2C-like domain-containing protein n=1 Tax=Polychytrium aggregatum TaxID=110093 RepID=UPI0022FF3D6B|nr:phosphatase 2C-like domain-containing protein [Polychytrium aggregatum]KAI9204149.1 phosphatase 2C-like domain-containing protein [Polychytrium aggregatum]